MAIQVPEEKVKSINNSLSGDGGLVIIKIGGNIIDDELKLVSFLKSFAAIKEKKILVHGGGKIATKIGEQLDIESKYVDGRRITDAATIDLVTMVYAGLINKKIIAQLQSYGCNAIGLTGADANMIPAMKRPVKEIDYGFVGDVKENEFATDTCALLLEKNIAVVFAPITHDGKGSLLNTNADTIAQETAKAMSELYEVSLVYSFEKAGVLLDANDDQTVIEKLGPAFYQQLKTDQKIFAGMIPKLDNAFAALKAGVKKVIIGKAEQLEELIAGTAGTTIINE
ncbi:MAG: acetylglutamate kinase [Ferruginibacter sp.]